MIICAAGHRLVQKTPSGYISKIERPDASRNSRHLREKMIDYATAQLVRHSEVMTVVSDLTPGWNLAVAKAAHNLGLELKIYIPHVDHSGKAQGKWWKPFHELLESTPFVYAPQVQFSPKALENHYKILINSSDSVLALWDGDKLDEPYQVIGRANRSKKPVDNVWEGWSSHNSFGEVVF